MNELTRALRETSAPDPAAEDRAWRLAAAAYARRPAARRAPRQPVRALAVAACAAALALVGTLTPAGGSVVRLVRQIASSSPTPALRIHRIGEPRRLPGGGRVLVLRAGAAYVVGGGVPPARLGPATQATFSAFGHYAALADGRRLSVAALDGRAVWSLREPQAVSAVRWAPDGLRIAYRAGRRLRIVDGNGENPRTLGTATGPAPAWRPGPESVLAYARTPRLVVLTDVATGADIARLRPPAHLLALAWSSEGRRLLALGTHEMRIFGADGRRVQTRRSPRGTTFQSAAFSPHGARLALLTRRPGGEVLAIGRRTVTAAPRLGQPTWSPDGRWLLTRAAGGWVFASTGRGRPEGRRAPALGAVSGWCCSPGR